MKFWQSLAFLEMDQLLDIAKASDELGYHGLTLSDHLFYPRDHITQYPYSADGAPIWKPESHWPDVWVSIAAMAAVTRDIRFTTNVYIPGVRDVFTVAKAVSTAAVLSKDRVAMGIGAGWSKNEFNATGQDFHVRGKRLDEMIPALRELWSPGWNEFHGDHIDFDALTMEPTPAKPVPIYVGGDSPAALSRAARLADGWIGIGYKPADAEERIGQLKQRLADEGRDDDDFEIILALYALPSVDLYGRFADLGVTGITWSPWMLANLDDPRFASPLQARLAACEDFATDIIAKLQ